MLIFLVRIPPNTTKLDIVNFISPALKGSLFSPAGVLDNIKMMELRDRRIKSTEYYAMVQVKPDKVALRVIRQLNRKRLKGKPINLRQYYIRKRKNERRLKNQYTALEIKEKRMLERRDDTPEMLEALLIADI